MFEATRWGHRGATINSISPGIIITPLANDELHGPRKEGYLKMIEGMPARRAGTPDEVGDLAEFLMSSRLPIGMVIYNTSKRHTKTVCRVNPIS